LISLDSPFSEFNHTQSGQGKNTKTRPWNQDNRIIPAILFLRQNFMSKNNPRTFSEWMNTMAHLAKILAEKEK